MINILKNYWWALPFYGFVALVIFLQRKLPTEFELKETTIVLVLLLILPLLFPRISKVELGGITFELGKLKQEVKETQDHVHDEVSKVREQYRDLSERLTKAIEKSADYLKPQALSISDEKAEEMRHSIDLSDSEVDFGLRSLDVNVRVPAYIDLQVRPRAVFFSQLIDCYWIEQLHARTLKETRPLWQLLVATGIQIKNPQEIPASERRRGRLLLAQTLEFFKSDPSIDPGNQCKQRIELLLTAFDKVLTSG